jgi:hypothetical protein
MRGICESQALPWIWFLLGLLLVLLGAWLHWRRTVSEAGVALRSQLIDFRGSESLFLILSGCALIIALILALRACREPQSAVSTLTNNNVTITQIHQQLNAGVDSSLYRISRAPRSDIIQDELGDFYYIDLKDRVSQSLIFFDLGKFERDEFSAAFREAWARVEHDILKPLGEARVPYEVFVLGSADSVDAHKPRLGTLMEGTSKTVTFYERSRANSNVFLRRIRTETIPADYSNRDLPNLRGSYVLDRLRASDVDAMLLEGSVKDTNDERDRNAMVLLYWPRAQGDTLR